MERQLDRQGHDDRKNSRCKIISKQFNLNLKAPLHVISFGRQHSLFNFIPKLFIAKPMLLGRLWKTQANCGIMAR